MEKLSKALTALSEEAAFYRKDNNRDAHHG
jgi:hypothetical protein